MSKPSPCILVVDDDVNVLNLLRRLLINEGYRVIAANNGEEALALFEKHPINMVLLDIIMPTVNGYEVCQRIRQHSTIPIIMLTAMGRDEDKVKGFDSGADDFVSKPFSTEVLLVRIKAVLRRSNETLFKLSCSTYHNGRLEIEFDKRWVSVDGREVRLTPTEFRLLHELLLNKGEILTHTQLLQRVWGENYQNEIEYVHVFVRKLRTKLGLRHQGSGAIESISSVGYRFNE
ncbi:MAG: response regulator transcription factor [Dehalococcoidia bacterium]|jgi:two-component system KDP operon response regulator KdpE